MLKIYTETYVHTGWEILKIDRLKTGAFELENRVNKFGFGHLVDI